MDSQGTVRLKVGTANPPCPAAGEVAPWRIHASRLLAPGIRVEVGQVKLEDVGKAWTTVLARRVPVSRLVTPGFPGQGRPRRQKQRNPRLRLSKIFSHLDSHIYPA